MPTRRKKRGRKNEGEAATPLPERDALSSLLGGTSLLSGASLPDATQTTIPTGTDTATSPLAGVVSQVSSAAQTAQQDPGATAQNIESDGSTSSAITPPPNPAS